MVNQMRAPILALISVLLASAQTRVKVEKTSVPEKALVFEVSIPAPRSEVWKAFTTTEGLQTWLGPLARVDLKEGGDWFVYLGQSTGGGTIQAFVREKEITIKALAPDRFPTVRAERTRARFEFSGEADGPTLVRLTQTGWKNGREWDQAYEYLAGGNAELLDMLRTRFVQGPIDWKKLMGGK